MNRRQMLIGATAAVVAPVLPPEVFIAVFEKSRDLGIIPRWHLDLVSELERRLAREYFCDPVWNHKILFGDATQSPGSGGLV